MHIQGTQSSTSANRPDIAHPGEIHWKSLKKTLYLLFCLISLDLIRIVSTKSIRNGLSKLSSTSFSQSFSALTGLRTQLFDDISSSGSSMSSSGPVFISPRTPLIILSAIPTIMLILTGRTINAPENALRNILRLILLGSFSFLFDFLFSIIVLDCVTSASLGLLMQSLILATALFALTHILTMLQAQKLWDDIWHRRRMSRLGRGRGKTPVRHNNDTHQHIHQRKGHGIVSSSLPSNDELGADSADAELEMLLTPQHQQHQQHQFSGHDNDNSNHTHITNSSDSGNTQHTVLGFQSLVSNFPDAPDTTMRSAPGQSPLDSNHNGTQNITDVPIVPEIRLPGPEQGVPRLSSVDPTDQSLKQTLSILRYVAGTLPLIGTQLSRKLGNLTSGYRME